MAKRQLTAAYLVLNGKYLREAKELIIEKDLPQASEKLWGAAAEMVKAVASKRGVELGTHASLWDYVGKLDRENPGLGLIDLFSYAGNLHVNFYEDMLPPAYVNRGFHLVQEFVSKLRKLL